MVNQFVVLVDLKYKRIVNVVTSEDLHSKACAEQYETNKQREVVGVSRRIYLTPIIETVRWRNYTQKQKETKLY